MTTIIKINRVFQSSSRVIREQLIRLEGDLSLSSLINTIGWKLIVLSIGSIKKATSRIRLYHKFSTYILVMTRRHGPEFTVRYLKACNLAVSKFLAGQPFKSLREIEPDLPLPRLSKSGLPAIIGTRDRRSLHANSHRVIRLWLTLFSLYRIIRIPSKSKLSTITDPFSGNSKFLEIAGNWMEYKAPTILERFYSTSNFKLQEKFSMGESASPSNSKSWVGMLTDVSLLKSSPTFFASFVRILEKTCTRNLIDTFMMLSILVPDVHSAKFRLLPMKGSFRELLEQHVVRNKLVNPLIGLGQLQQKEEAAGKMRTFAMVDSWTQTVLLPVHTYISNLLNELPNDGTADHGRAFDRVLERSQEFGCSYGYDLSAATDRLPIALQMKLLSGLFGKQFADDWANVLVGRPYTLVQKDKATGALAFRDYIYKVGQPMGARSSFAMLGLTHHMIVQYCAHMLGSQLWENRYEIVGDDIIIFNKDLAMKYLEVMSLIGVPINESKSVIAENRPVAEFVKRVAINGKDVSPFSWKQFISQNNYLGRIGTTIGLFKKEISLAEKAISIFHLVLKEKIYDSRPMKDSLALVSLWITYAMKSSMSVQNVMRALFLHNPTIKDGSLIFTSFNFHEIGAKVKQMILTGRPPVDASFHPDFLAINHFLTGSYFSKVLKLRKSWWVDRIRLNQQLILRKMFGDLWSEDQILLDIRTELLAWMRYQDPLLGAQGYPWLTWCEDLAYMTERYRTLSHLEVSYKLYQECLGKLSFLNIHKRVDEVTKAEVLDVVDSSLLRDLVQVYNKVQSAKSRKAQEK